MRSRKDGAVAVFATARKLAQLVYRTLRYGQQYVDIGDRTYELRFQRRCLAALQNAAKSLGYMLVEEISPG